MMLCQISDTTDIYFNLALEEFLMKQRTEDFLLLWESETSVVIGKHQNAMAEINYWYLKENHIPVARRLSGGGTVYHGPGNLNFTFIRNGEMGKLVNFEQFVSPVIAYLKSLGIPAAMGHRNDILVKGLKISGNAEHVYKKRVLHHGTLLFNANLGVLTESIKVTPGRFIDKAVQSNRSQVANIVDFLEEPMRIEEFKSGLFKFLLNTIPDTENFTLKHEELQEIEWLKTEKYSTKDWIFGYSPNFKLRESFQFEGETYHFDFEIEKGNVKEVSLHFPGYTQIQHLEQLFISRSFELSEFDNILAEQVIIPDNLSNKFLETIFK